MPPEAAQLLPCRHVPQAYGLERRPVARWRLLVFTGTWLVLSGAGLLLTYWVSTLPLGSNLTNTSYRTIVSLLIGGAAVAPLFVFPRGGSERE